jgi:uncharacterized protein
MDEMTGIVTRAAVEQAERILNETPFGYLAMIEPGGPYVVPLNFAFVPAGVSATSGKPNGALSPSDPARLEGRIYFHTGEGRKVGALAADPRVCLAVTVATGFEQGDTPCADGFSYRSLLIWGRARRLDREEKRELALREIVAKYDPDAVDRPFEEVVFDRTIVYEVVIETASYKQQPR